MTYSEVASLQEMFDKLGAAGDKVTVICFHLSYCPACRGIAPQFKKLTAKYSEPEYLRVEVQSIKEAIERFNLQAVPTFVSFLWQEEIDRYVGAKEEPLEKFLQQSIQEGKSRLLKGKGKTEFDEKKKDAHDKAENNNFKFA